MQIRIRILGAMLWLLPLWRISAAILYVDGGSTNSTPPYVDWATAAADIQSAIDASQDGDLILVTNGLYATGGRSIHGPQTNRVAVDKAVTVQSINGPEATIIEGYQVPDLFVGDAAVRGVYLTNNAVLIGFTVTNGATRNPLQTDPVQEQNGGGIWCESTNAVISNCVITANTCINDGAGVYSGTLYDCLLVTNLDRKTSYGGGGGAAFSQLVNCVLSNNVLKNPSGMGGGGGALSCTLSNCVLVGNNSSAVDHCVLVACTLTNNSGINGGAAYVSTLDNCLIASNAASSTGGGAYDCALNNCIVSNNFSIQGGGICFHQQTNSPGENNLVIGNFASNGGGGIVCGAALTFSKWVVSSNSTPGNGGGFYLGGNASLSECTLTGNTAGGKGAGLYHPSPSFRVTATNSIFIGNITPDDGGGAYWSGLYGCILLGNQAANGGGVYGTATDCNFVGNVATNNGGGLYYYFPGGSPYPPVLNCTFTNNVAANGGGANGGSSYGNFSNCTFSANFAATNGGGAYSGRFTNCVIISNVAGKDGGGIYGGPSTLLVNCQLGHNAATNNAGGLYTGTATGCQFRSNFAGNNGGGWFSISTTLSNCLFAGNSSLRDGGGTAGGKVTGCQFLYNHAGGNGGGSAGSALENCLVCSNSAAYGGGAAGPLQVVLNSSTFTGNSASTNGGGIYAVGGQVSQCIIYNNTAPQNPNFWDKPGFNNCCLPLPLPTHGQNNITNAPDFIDPAMGNFRLQAGSPCINAGSATTGAVDLDGRPRVVGGIIDIGAYEYQGAGIGEFSQWLELHHLPTDGSADYVDSDGDGLNNWQEWIAGTDPNDPESVLKLLPVTPGVGPEGNSITWQSVSGITYFLERSSDLSASPPFSSIQSNILGQAGTTTFVDPTATNNGSFFYRVGVQ